MGGRACVCVGVCARVERTAGKAFNVLRSRLGEAVIADYLGSRVLPLSTSLLLHPG